MSFLVAVIGFIAGLFGGGAGAVFAANLIVGSLVSIGVSAVIGGISKLLRKSPSVGASISNDGRSQTVRQPIAPRVVVYGRAGRLGGVITFVDVTGASDEFIHLVITFAGHRIQSFDKFYFDGVEVWPVDVSGKYGGAILLDTRLGHDDQTAFADLIAYDPLKWTTNHRQRGCACAYFRLTYSQAMFPNGVPNITADIHGKDDVYDPRLDVSDSTPIVGIFTTTTAGHTALMTLVSPGIDLSPGDPLTVTGLSFEPFNRAFQIVSKIDDTHYNVGAPDASPAEEFFEGYGADVGGTGGTAHTSGTPEDAKGYSENPVLCLRDYLVGRKWGLRANDVEIDDLQTIAGANLCDEELDVKFTVASPATEPRYALNGSFSTDAKPSDVIQTMLSSMAGRLVSVGGKFGIFPGSYLSPTVSLDESHLRGPIDVTTSVPKTDLSNGVKGVYIAPENEWQPSDFPAVLNDDYVTEDNGEVLFRDIELGWTISPAMAQRLAKIELERARRQIQVTLQCNLKAYLTKVTDTIQLSIERYGWVNKTFEVLDLKFAVTGQAGAPTLGIDLQLRETDADVFAWDAETEEKETNTPTGTIVFPGATPTGPRNYNISYTGMPTSGQIEQVTIEAESTLPMNMTGSRVTVGTNPTADAEFTVNGSTPAYDIDGNFIGYNGITFGTVTIHTDGTATFASSADGFLPLSEPLFIVAPASPDATLADLVFTFKVR